ncbi:NEL-type E3 ubiquitin ligase domain-containing protein [Rhabdochlamydiaceae symbiont of Dictyostelium giganteum]|uniref:NEL-type E3 ubiquitin ligase domain-containing protein n=1 Tax=Rhabdochlamydiaceae symbiont of Dictyostelium giganteum TaxID=3342349 RepID=UPI00384CF62D
MDLSNIWPLTSSSLHPSLGLDQQDERYTLLAEELNHLTNGEHLPKRILIQGNIKLSSSNIQGFLLLQTKDVEIEGSLTCDAPFVSQFLQKEILHAPEDPFCFLPQQLYVKGNVDFSHLSSLSLLPQRLEIEGSLNLSHCIGITALPTGLKVKQHLILINCKHLTHLPVDLTIEGDLVLTNCTALTTLSKGLKVTGYFQIINCINITHLPDDLVVEGSFILTSCLALKTLPKGFTVKQNLFMAGSANLTHLPSDLVVEGHLDLSDCTSITDLPQGFRASQDLILTRCTNLTHLPVDLVVEGNLNLSHCTNITALPEGLIVGQDLNLSECTRLAHLPRDLVVEGDLDLSLCTSITALPEGLIVGQDLNLFGCTSLTHLPSDLVVDGDLDLSLCKNITALPQGLIANQNLNLSECTSLTHLPSDLTVEGDLDLSYCTNMTALPHSLKVGGNLNLSGCTHLTSLPNWIATLGLSSDGNKRIIDLTGCGLSPTTILRLQEAVGDNPDITIHFSENAAEEYITQFTDLFEAVTFWQEEAMQTLPITVEEMCGKIHHTLTQVQDHQNLLDFLMRLTGTTDYANRATKRVLAKRILTVIQLMAEDEQLCLPIAFLIHQGLSSCDDRVIATLDDISFYQKLRTVQHVAATSEEVKNLGRGFFLLEELNKKIRNHIQTLSFVDEVEVFMAFHIRLQEMLSLPIDTKTMLFRRCVMVSDEEIDGIGRDVLQEVQESAFEAFLDSWDPWKEHQRKTSIPTWDNLPLLHHPLLPHDICPYLQDKPEQPVLYNNVIYDYTAFRQRYIQAGVDLYGAAVQVEKLYRIEPSITHHDLDPLNENSSLDHLTERHSKVAKQT